MIQLQIKKLSTYQDLLSQGIAEFEAGRSEYALLLFKQAAVASFGSAEPWFWIGRIREEDGDRVGAAYCFYMACDMGGAFAPAKQALKRLGYLEGGHGGPHPSMPAFNLGTSPSSIQGVKP